MLPVTLPELNSVAQAVGALSAGPAGFGIHMNVASSNIDTSAPTMTLELDKGSLQSAENRINNNFRGAARQSVQRVMNRVHRRTHFTPNGRRRDMGMRHVSSRDLQAIQRRKLEFDRLPRTKQVGLNPKLLSDVRQEQIVEEALDKGISVINGLMPKEPMLRRRLDAGLKKDPMIDMAPVLAPRRKLEDDQLKARAGIKAPRLRLWAMIGAPSPLMAM